MPQEANEPITTFKVEIEVEVRTSRMYLWHELGQINDGNGNKVMALGTAGVAALGWLDDAQDHPQPGTPLPHLFFSVADALKAALTTYRQDVLPGLQAHAGEGSEE